MRTKNRPLDDMSPRQLRREYERLFRSLGPIDSIDGYARPEQVPILKEIDYIHALTGFRPEPWRSEILAAGDPRIRSRPIASIVTLEQWHRSYDDALGNGADPVEAVAIADDRKGRE